MLRNFDIDNKAEQMWNYTETLLTREGVSINETLDLKASWDKYEVDKMDLSNTYLLSIQTKVRDIVKSYRKEGKITQLNAQLIRSEERRVGKESRKKITQ